MQEFAAGPGGQLPGIRLRMPPKPGGQLTGIFNFQRKLSWGHLPGIGGQLPQELGVSLGRNTQQAEVAAWVLSFGVETTVLVITCNVKHFSSKRLPLFFAACSGFIVLFFIRAFDFTQPALDVAIRWFMGLLVSGVNFVYAELFVKKFQETQVTTDLLHQVETLKNQNAEENVRINQVNADLQKANQDIEKLLDYVAELEAFKKKEIDRLTCSHCAKVFTTIYHLNSHRSICEKNPKKGHKESVFEAVV